MASTINGTSTGNGGLISTGDDSGILNIQKNETTAISIDASQNATFAGKVTSAGALTLASNGTTTAVTIDTAGNVGLGTTTPARKFHVRQGGVTTLANTNGSLFTDAGNAGVLLGSDNVLGYISGVTAAGTATVDMALQPFGGNVMVNATSALARFSVYGQAGSNVWVQSNTNTGTGAIVSLGFRNDNGLVGYVQTSGSSTTYVTSSDYRLKDNIVPMTGALAKVAQLKPVTYKWKVDNTQSQGFIAHELQEVVPECVTGDKDATRQEEYEITPAVKDEQGNITTPAVMGTRTVPSYQGIDTSFLVATLTAALQETKALIDTQAETINALTARIVALESK
jgi:hypothetical protein